MNFYVEHCADSFEFLRSVPAGAFDHVLTDPPFDEHCQKNQTSGTAYKKMVRGEIAATGIPKKELEFPPLTDYRFATDLVRVAKRWALSFCTVEAFGEFRRVVGPERYVRGCVWYKTNAMGQLTKDRPAACYEGIAVMHSEAKKVWNGVGSYGLWPANGTRGKKGRHDNEKPLDLCMKLIALFTSPGDWIFDPWCGSSAIGEAALLLGRRYYGLDWDASWVEKSQARLAAVEFASVPDSVALAGCTAKRSEVVAQEFDPCDDPCPKCERDRELGSCMCLPATEFYPVDTSLCRRHGNA